MPSVTPSADPGELGRSGVASPVLTLDAATWCEVPVPDGVEFVIVHETSPVGLIQENLTVNEQGFDPDHPPVDATTAEAFRPTLHGCAAVTARWHGVPVAAGMFTPVVDGRAELVGITTLGHHRGRGLGAAVTSRIVQAAFEAGAHTLFLAADDEAALRIYRRIGFH
jgi:GNAT superfamily N-acetyltransferase